jgi:hypothetical protein
VIDGAASALRPVRDLPSTHRNNGIVVSAQRVRQATMNGPASNVTLNRELCAEIEVFPKRRPALPRR